MTSKFGNTKRAAEKIMDGMRGSEGVETDIGYVKEIDKEEEALNFVE